MADDLQLAIARQRLERAALTYAAAPLDKRQLVTGDLERAARAFEVAYRDSEVRRALIELAQRAMADAMENTWRPADEVG